ncbi:MAG TPA: MFS transporter, partial [Anaeromyxobacter sp.]
AIAVALLAEAPAPWIVGLVSDRSSLGRSLAILVPLALAIGGGAWLLGAWRARRAARGPSRPRA